LYVIRIVINQIVLIVIAFLQNACLNNVVMFNLYTLILHTFNLYAFFCQIVSINFVFSQFVSFIAKGQDVFRQTKKKPWPFTPLKKLYASLVTYKGKFKEGIISLFEHYEDFKVCQLLSFKLY